jgi:hypothetical protein
MPRQILVSSRVRMAVENIVKAELDPMIAGPEGGPSSDMQRFED